MREFFELINSDDDTNKNTTRYYHIYDKDELEEIISTMSEAPAIYAEYDTDLKFCCIEYAIGRGCIDTVYTIDKKLMRIILYLPDSPLLKSTQNNFNNIDVITEGNIVIDNIVFCRTKASA
ncbi:MAG: hypothetical protein WBI55_09900 [Eubacteriales bacterium]|jgi:hypothetical protein|nr:hypothetical protein [Clostridiales bacterium]